MSEVKQSINKIQVVGEISEINLKDEKAKTKIKDNKGVEHEIECGVISKDDFKSAAMTVKVAPKDDDGNERFDETLGIEFYPVKEKKYDKDGNLVDNSRYKSFQTIMKYTKGTRVKIDGSLNMNEYASSKDGKNYDFYSKPQINAFQITSSGVPENDMAEGNISGIIQKIVPEMRTKNEAQEETGRSLVELYFFDNRGNALPNTFIVNKDMADEFSDVYEAGQSVKFDYEIFSHQVGGTKPKVNHAFGSRESQVTSGFTVVEYQVFGGDAPFEEENEYYIELPKIKEAKAARQNYIDTIIDDKKKSDKENKTGGGSAKKSGLGNRASKVKEEEFHSPEGDEELPF